MCERYSVPKQIRLQVGGEALAFDLPERSCAHPLQQLPVVVADSGKPRVAPMNWGWTGGRVGQLIINVLAENVRTKFRETFRERRCVVPARDFYLRQSAGTAKLPWRFALADETGFFMAGIYEKMLPQAPTRSEISIAGEPSPTSAVDSFVVITVLANGSVARIHNRMPAMLEPDDLERWLSPETKPTDAAAMLRTFPGSLETFRVNQDFSG
jgi:putative SOS response-associated peptidase YedK